MRGKKEIKRGRNRNLKCCTNAIHMQIFTLKQTEFTPSRDAWEYPTQWNRVILGNNESLMWPFMESEDLLWCSQKHAQTCPWSVSWTRLIKSTPSQPLYLRYILILFPMHSQIFQVLSLLHVVPIPPFDYPNNIRWQVQVMKFLRV